MCSITKEQAAGGRDYITKDDALWSTVLGHASPFFPFLLFYIFILPVLSGIEGRGFIF